MTLQGNWTTRGWSAQQASWTDERVSALRRYAADGMSAREIALELGSVSRNAVIGKLTRLGLTRGKTGHRRSQKVAASKPKQIRQYRGPWPNAERPEPEIVPDDTPPDQSAFACTIIELKPDMCRWIMDHGLYCGAPCVGSWCGRHRRIVFTRPGARA